MVVFSGGSESHVAGEKGVQGRFGISNEVDPLAHDMSEIFVLPNPRGTFLALMANRGVRVSGLFLLEGFRMIHRKS